MRGWNDYFFMVGSAAAALIGLMFVVATLTAGRDPNELEAGKKLYTSPIVWHLAVVVVLSGGALAPDISQHWFGAATIAIALLGAAYGSSIALGILRAQLASDFSGYDAFWYGFLPALLYGTLALSGWGVMGAAPWAPDAFASGIMALLLTSIHNEWDLVTFLAPAAAPGTISTDREAG